MEDGKEIPDFEFENFEGGNEEQDDDFLDKQYMGVPFLEEKGEVNSEDDTYVSDNDGKEDGDPSEEIKFLFAKVTDSERVEETQVIADIVRLPNTPFEGGKTTFPDNIVSRDHCPNTTVSPTTPQISLKSVIHLDEHRQPFLKSGDISPNSPNLFFHKCISPCNLVEKGGGHKGLLS